MALKRAPGAPKAELNQVEFPMQDAVTGVVVSCRISEDALRKLSGGGSSISALESMFNEHRDAAESLASAKYDRGHTSPHVVASDF
jgi:hypothetical protein